MDPLQAVTQSISADGMFELRIQDGSPINVRCTIRFVFLIIESEQTKSIAFLPEYGPAIFGIENTGNSIMFSPLDVDLHSMFTISSKEYSLIQNFFNYASNSYLVIKKFCDVIDRPLEKQEYLVYYYGLNSVERPICLILRDNKLILDENETVIDTIEITSRTKITLSDIRMEPMFGVSNKMGQIIWFQSFNITNVIHWFLSIYLTKQYVIEQQQNLLNKIKIPETIETIASPVKQIPQNVNRVSLESMTPVNKQKEVISKTTPEPTYKKADEKKLERREELQKQNNSLLSVLNIKKSQYKEKSWLTEEKEPEISVIQQTSFDPVQKIEFPELHHNPIDKSTLLEIMSQKYSFVRPSPSHYLKNPVKIPGTFKLNLPYNANSPFTFLNRYKDADPQLAYQLLVSLVMCQFSGKSILDAYNVKANTSLPQVQAMYVVDYYKSDLPSYILSHPEILSNYRISALVYDKELLKSLPKKQLQKVSSFQVQYSFPHDPMKDLRTSMNNALMSARLRQFDPIKVFQDFSRSWIAVFQHHCKQNLLEPLFVRLSTDIARNNETWNIFREESELRQKWPLFLLHSMRDERVVENLLVAISAPQILHYFYDDCALIRRDDIVEELVFYTCVFASFRIKISNNGTVEEPLPGPQFDAIFK